MLANGEKSVVYLCHKRGDKAGAVKYAVKLYNQKTLKRGKLARLGDKLKYRAIKRLNHPNVVKTLDLIEQDGGRYWVMEYVDGAPLDELVQKGVPLRDEEIARVARGAAAAFKYLERNQMKPFIVTDPMFRHIIVRADGSACVIDIEPRQPLSNNIGFYAGHLLGLRRVYRKATMYSYIKCLGMCALLMALAPNPLPPEFVYWYDQRRRDEERLPEWKRRALARGYDKDLIGLAVASVADPSAVKYADWERILSASA